MEEDRNNNLGHNPYSRYNASSKSTRNKRVHRNIPIIVAFIVAAAVLAIGGYYFLDLVPVKITIEGKAISVPKQTTYKDLASLGYGEDKNGDFVAVDGSVIEKGKGEPAIPIADGEKVDKMSDRVQNGSTITFEKGDDICESSHTEIREEPYAFDVEGGENFNFYNDVLHVITQDGENGEAEYRIGNVSGKSVKLQEIKNPTTMIMKNIDPEIDSQSDKVIALTFDDGPSPKNTEKLLKVLAKYKVKATFFMLGSEVDAHPEIAKEVADQGHQVASHTYSHDSADYLNKLDANGVQQQLKKAQDSIYNATGVKTTCVRPPGGNIDYDGVLATKGLAKSLVGWTGPMTSPNQE
ncbi:MAG: polysaccharide deacetylase family protein [Coriobacteriales bacterium]|jgi:sulfur carrier protein ThiS